VSIFLALALATTGKL